MKTPHSRWAGGFTLIEMIITLSVFLLLVGAIFSIFGATLESAGTLQDSQNREDEAQALGAWLRHSFLALPADGTLVSYHRDGRPFRVSGIIWGAGNDLQALDLQVQANGNYTLRLASFQPSGASDSLSGIAGASVYSAALLEFQTEVFNDDSALSWRLLVRDLRSADWRFRTANSVDWSDVATAGKPVAAEFTFQPAGMLSAIVDDFWIPPVQPPDIPALAPAAPAVTINP